MNRLNAAECVGFGGQCECNCDCCMGKCEAGTDHRVDGEHSTILCPQSKRRLYTSAAPMIHDA